MTDRAPPPDHDLVTVQIETATRELEDAVRRLRKWGLLAFLFIATGVGRMLLATAAVFVGTSTSAFGNPAFLAGIGFLAIGWPLVFFCIERADRATDLRAEVIRAKGLRDRGAASEAAYVILGVRARLVTLLI